MLLLLVPVPLENSARFGEIKVFTVGRASARRASRVAASAQKENNIAVKGVGRY